MSYTPQFDEKKTTQLAAYFTAKSGGEIYHLMLMKLLYISDRRALSTLGHTISNDNFASMNYGPVLLNTLSLIGGTVRFHDSLWEKYLTSSRNYKIALRQEQEIDTGLLSQAELDIADSVYNEFGHMNRFDLADKTHEFPEWHDPHGSVLPIQYKDILLATGFDDHDAEIVLEELEDIQASKNFLNNL